MGSPKKKKKQLVLRMYIGVTLTSVITFFPVSKPLGCL